MEPSRLRSLALLLLATHLPLFAQSSLLLPSTATAAPGTSHDNVSWGNYAPTGATGFRLQACYPAANFNARGIGSRIAIQGVWFRSSAVATAPVGGVDILGAGIAMSTMHVPVAGLGLAFAANHGADRTDVHAGPISVLPAATQGVLYVHVAFTQPFVYDPFAGDLLFDIRYPFAGLTHLPAGSHARNGDAMNGGGSLVFGDSGLAFASNSYAGVPIVQFDYAAVPGAASVATRGTGCVDLRSSAYEQFESAAPLFDLADRRLQFTRQADRYTMTCGAGSWTTPATTTVLALGDDICSPPIALPFAFPYLDRNGVVRTTTQVVVSSNGYLWLDGAQTVSDFTPTAAELCGLAPRIAACWSDLTPDLGGTVSHGTSAGGAVFHVSWDRVPQYQHPASLVSVQVSLSANGDFRLDFAAGAPVLTSIVGWSPGLGALLAPGIDLSAAGPRDVRRDVLALQLTALTRPVLGSVHTARVDNIDAGTGLGAMCLGLTPAQAALEGFGLTGGCTRWSAWDVIHLLLPTGNAASWQLPVPADASLVGLPIHEQAVMFSPGLNPAGIVVSNGVLATVGDN